MSVGCSEVGNRIGKTSMRIQTGNNRMKTVVSLALLAIFLSGCVTKQTKTDSRGIIREEKYIIKRPVKNFIENVEFE